MREKDLKELLDALIDSDRFWHYFERLLTKDQVSERTGLSKSEIDRREADVRFPKRVVLSRERFPDGTPNPDGKPTMVRWRLSDIQRWIAENTINH